MAINIMMWNIQQFGVNKFLFNLFDPGQARQTHIMNTIRTSNPDILIVIEVKTATGGGSGSLVSDTSGGPACLALLYALRDWQPANNWCLVPPLILGTDGNREAIAVFFNSQKFSFLGPYQYDANFSQPIGSQAAQNYPPPWDNTLPPGAAPNIPGYNQNQLAGKFEFASAAAPAVALNFPNPWNRDPFLTTFLDHTTNPARTIKLFSFHAPSTAPDRYTAFARLAAIQEIGAPLVANELRVIAGDFNVNRLNPGQAPIYQHLMGGPVAVMGEMVCPINYNIAYNERTVLSAVPYADTTGVAPYYNYSAVLGGYGACLDNFLIAPFATPAAFHVVNRVVGLPMGVTSALTNQIGTAAVGPPATLFSAGVFRNITNFGKIGGMLGASDHMSCIIQL
jgi:hypothetical protein